MRVAFVLLGVVILSVVFHVVNPFTFSDIASNWQLIDITLFITFWITGIVFVLLGVFTAWAVYRYRYRPHRRAKYEPENPTLEVWLTSITTVGVVVMLAPGLVAWADYINVPEDAMTVEVLGKQWDWKYRYPGEDGVFGRVLTECIDPQTNVFGMACEDEGTEDPFGEDDILIDNKTMFLPVGRNIKIQMRSQDVLHDFWVPEIRAKMDMVPGMITYFWFQPTRTESFDILCAELCGVNHHNMRGVMNVVQPDEFATWLSSQKTWAEIKAGAKPETPEEYAGRMVATKNGCFACHTADGAESIGPTWLDLMNRETLLDDGTTVIADEAYIRTSITDPNDQVVADYDRVMTPYELSEEDMSMLLIYLGSLSSEE